MTWQPTFTTTLGYGVSQLSCLVYGCSGAGKTSLFASTGDPDRTLILAAEPGLLPLRHLSIRVIEIDSLDTLLRVVSWLEGWAASGSMSGWWVGWDTMTEIAERVLADLKLRVKDPRQAYAEVQDVMVGVLKRIRSLPCHTVVLAKQDRFEDGDKGLIYGPMLPGKKGGPRLAYEFDLVMAMRVERVQTGEIARWLQTQYDGRYDAKDRSGALDQSEPPNLAHLANKILGAVQPSESGE